jgi:hypothetical protein
MRHDQPGLPVANRVVDFSRKESKLKKRRNTTFTENERTIRSAMAPPEHTFPVSQLEQEIHYHSVNLKVKARKLGDFDLQRDCELLELVQYSCTTPEQQYERVLKSPTGMAQMECFPFVRLFRKYACTHISDLILRSIGTNRNARAGARREIKCSMSKQQHGKASMPGLRLRIHALQHQRRTKAQRKARRVGSGLRNEPFPWGIICKCYPINSSLRQRLRSVKQS